MNFSSVQTCFFTDPLFRHLSSSIAFSICAQLTNVRPNRSLLAISSLLNPLITASPSAPQIWLGKSIALAHEAFLSRPYFLTQVACRWLRSPGGICYSLQDYAVTPSTRLHPFEAHTFMLVPFLLRSRAWTSWSRYSEAYTLALFRLRLVPPCFRG
jgi:hypothetical protein